MAGVGAGDAGADDGDGVGVSVGDVAECEQERGPTGEVAEVGGVGVVEDGDEVGANVGGGLELVFDVASGVADADWVEEVVGHTGREGPVAVGWRLL